MADLTNVPGMNFTQGNGGFNNPYGAPRHNNPYDMADDGATYVPGMAHNAQPEAPKAAEPSTKPIVGFLYSVSRVPTGEFWPVYQGSNIIGRDATCDICLAEASISRQHARLVVRKNRNPEKTIAAITDLGSTEGTMVNGESLDFDACECHNGDKITFGRNYELLFILIDTKALGLKPAEEFIAVAGGNGSSAGMGSNSIGNEPQQPVFPGPGMNMPPSFVNPDAPRDRQIPSDGTVGMDGFNSNDTGGTQIAF